MLTPMEMKIYSRPFFRLSEQFWKNHE